MLAAPLSPRHSTLRVRERLFSPGLLQNDTNKLTFGIPEEYSTSYFLATKIYAKQAITGNHPLNRR
jgi:hypothetical protein